MSAKIYQGLLCLHTHGDANDVLFLSSLKSPLAEELEWMSGKNVTVRYWITEAPCTKEQAIESAMLIVMGFTQVNFWSRYSELTGYLWTDEDLIVGGHDLIAELKSHTGKWLIMEIEREVRSERRTD